MCNRPSTVRFSCGYHRAETTAHFFERRMLWQFVNGVRVVAMDHISVISAKGRERANRGPNANSVKELAGNVVAPATEPDVGNVQRTP